MIKKSLPSTRTIVFTMYDDAIQTLAPAMGVNAVLSKKDGLPDLLRAVRTLLSDKFKLIEDSLAQAAQNRRTNRNHLESLTTQLAVPLTRCSRDLKYLWVNSYYAEWLQKPVEKIVGRSILNVMGKEAFDSVRLRFDQVLGGEDVVYQARVNFDKIGPQRISAVYKPTMDRNGTPDGWLAFVQDIAATVNTEAA